MVGTQDDTEWLAQEVDENSFLTGHCRFAGSVRNSVSFR